MRDRTVHGSGEWLRDLLPAAAAAHARHVRVSGLAVDASECQSGDVVFLSGSTGLVKRLQIAEKRGAAAVVVDQPIEQSSIPLIQVNDCRKAVRHVVATWLARVSRWVKVIGVAGMAGKTSTGYLIASILENSDQRVGIAGSLGCCDGCDVDLNTATPLSSVDLLRWLLRMEQNGCTHAIVEISDAMLGSRSIRGVEFDVVCVTNLAKTCSPRSERRRADVRRLLEQVSSQGVVILNADDDGSAALADHLSQPAIMTGLAAGAEISAIPIEQVAADQTFLLTMGADTAAVRVTLPGAHNLSNCLMAAGVGAIYGIGLVDVARGLEAVKKMPGRLERVDCGQVFPVFIDCARTARAVLRVIRSVAPFAPGRVIAVSDAYATDDESIFGATRAAAEVRIVPAAALSQRSRRVGELPLGALQSASVCRRAADRTEAIEWALSQARAGDCVVIAGKRNERASLDGASELTDREIVSRWLYRSAVDDVGRRASA